MWNQSYQILMNPICLKCLQTIYFKPEYMDEKLFFKRWK